MLPTTKLVRSVEDVTLCSVASSFFGKGKLSGFILVTDLSLAEILLKNHVIFSDVFRCSIVCR